MAGVDRDAVVVGGGILGLLVAVLLAEEGRDVDVYVSPAPEPRSDSQRNHSWLQSGLLYPKNKIARRMYYDGLDMLDKFAVRHPTKQGLFRFASKEEANDFLAHAKEIQLLGKVQEVSDGEARRWLGAFHQPGRFHFRVPDAPFPEAQVMELARSRAALLGVRFLKSRVRLERDEGSETGYVLISGDERIVPRLTVVCAGAGTPKLLESLGINHPLVVNQSVLLVIYDVCAMRVPLLADRSSGLTVVAWAAKEIPPSGRIVVGAGDRRELETEERDVVRRVRREEQDFLVGLLPPDVSLSLREDNHRFTAGQKTDVRAYGKSRVESWIHRCRSFPGLIFATPGKATLALRVAQAVLELATEQPEVLAPSTRSSVSRQTAPEPPPTTRYKEAIRSHHHPRFDKLDEREKE